MIVKFFISYSLRNGLRTFKSRNYLSQRQHFYFTLSEYHPALQLRSFTSSMFHFSKYFEICIISNNCIINVFFFTYF